MFAKVFTQILDSSLAEDYQTRHVFEDLLKLCDLNGVVDMTPEAIARRTNAPLDIVKKGITELEKPDPRSRNPDHDGRRIIRLDEHRDWGWSICNYDIYRAIESEDDRRQKTKARVQKFRERRRHPGLPPAEPRDALVTPGDACNAPVTDVNAPVTDVNAGNGMQKQKQMQMQMQKQNNFNVNLVNATTPSDGEKHNTSVVENHSGALRKTTTKVRSPFNQAQLSESAGAPLPLSVEVFNAWNETAKAVGLPACLVLSDSRRRKLAVRVKDNFFATNWKTALDKISKSAFCLGCSERGWLASLDWFITPDAVPKVMEGKYDAVNKTPTTGTGKSLAVKLIEEL